jgi:hypothetical protein
METNSYTTANKTIETELLGLPKKEWANRCHGCFLRKKYKTV